MTLRWKKDNQVTGLASIGAGPRGSKLREDGKVYASAQAHRVNFRTVGWYWVAGWDSDVPHFNSCAVTLPDEASAKAEAMAYVKTHIGAKP